MVKWSELEADHSPPSSAVNEISWNYTFTPPYAFMACRGTVKPLFNELLGDYNIFH
jgi:hypothetical protein